MSSKFIVLAKKAKVSMEKASAFIPKIIVLYKKCGSHPQAFLDTFDLAIDWLDC